MAGKKGKAGGGTGSTSKGSSSGGAGSSAAGARAAQQASGGGCDGQPASANARQKPAGGQAGRSGGRKGKGRRGPAGDLTPKQLLRAMAALGLRPRPVATQRPELARPSLPGIALLQRIGQLSAGAKLVDGAVMSPIHDLRFDFDMAGSEVTSCEREFALRLLSTSMLPSYEGDVIVLCVPATEDHDPETGMAVMEVHVFNLRGGQAHFDEPLQVEVGLGECPKCVAAERLRRADLCSG